MSYWKVHTQNKVKAWLIGPEKVQATFIFRQFITYIYTEKTNRPKVPAPWVPHPGSHTPKRTPKQKELITALQVWLPCCSYVGLFSAALV